MKLVVNMIMGSFMAASAEGLELAKGVGLKDEDLIEVVNMAAIATPMFKLKVRGLVQNLGLEAKFPTSSPNFVTQDTPHCLQSLIKVVEMCSWILSAGRNMVVMFVTLIYLRVQGLQ